MSRRAGAGPEQPGARRWPLAAGLSGALPRPVPTHPANAGSAALPTASCSSGRSGSGSSATSRSRRACRSRCGRGTGASCAPGAARATPRRERPRSPRAPLSRRAGDGQGAQAQAEAGGGWRPEESVQMEGGAQALSAAPSRRSVPCVHHLVLIFQLIQPSTTSVHPASCSDCCKRTPKLAHPTPTPLAPPASLACSRPGVPHPWPGSSGLHVPGGAQCCKSKASPRAPALQRRRRAGGQYGGAAGSTGEGLPNMFQTPPLPAHRCREP